MPEEDSDSSSLDDMLEEQRTDRLNNHVGQDKLEEDNSSPAEPTEDSIKNRPADDHPSQDSEVDSAEKYLE